VDSGMVSKIEKARRYAEDKDRVRFVQFEVSLRGDNSAHTVTFSKGVWQCGCRFFAQRAVCSHTMAMERILDGMLPDAGPAGSAPTPEAS
jgi:hypothetical protein